MKGKVNIIIDLLILSSAILITIGFISLSKGLSKSEEINLDKSSSNIMVNRLSKEEKIDVDKIIENVSQNKNIIRQSEISNIYLSLLLIDENNIHSSYIINKKTGEVKSFLDCVADENIDLFWNKVYELLYNKYPTFIVDAIKKGEGSYYFDILPNEVDIYFENYSFKPSIDKLISIKVNYNEIIDLIDFVPVLDETYSNEDGFNYDPNIKTIAFSFDDGPSGDKTKSVVDALINNKAHATFFMVGNKMYNYKEQLLYVYNNGLEIGQHTFSHINLKKTGMDKIKSEIKNTSNNFKNITGSEIKLFRPPYGAYTTDIMNQIDYPFILWSVDTNDWKYKDTDRTVNYILNNVYDGCIVLMHDSYDTTVEAVKKVLPMLYARGYQVVSVSELAELKGKTISSHNSYRSFE